MKKKFQSKFKIKCRGYDTREVDSFIAEQKSKNDSALVEQKERIAVLKQQNDSLLAELSVLKSREEQIKVTLLKATKNAEELDAQIKKKYKAELERLRLFRAKWTNAYEELKERYHFSKDALNMESVAVQTELDLAKYLSQEFSLARGDDVDDMEAYFNSEVARLTKLQQDYETNIESKSKELKSKIKQTEKSSVNELKDEGAFSLDEAINPSESLVDICKSLGLGEKL